jgi:hypothetical protein
MSRHEEWLRSRQSRLMSVDDLRRVCPNADTCFGGLDMREAVCPPCTRDFDTRFPPEPSANAESDARV